MADYSAQETFDYATYLSGYAGATADASPAQQLLQFAAAPDAVAPAVSGVAPVSGSSIAVTDPVQFDLTDNLGDLGPHVVSVVWGSGDAEVVYDGGFKASYTAGSTRTAITNGYRFVLLRTPGWSGSFSVRVVAVDGDGNALEATAASYTVSGSAGAVSVLGLSPTDGTAIDANTPLVFDVRSLVAISRVVATIRFSSLRFTEVAYAGDPAVPDAFEDAYASSSSVQTITDGAYYRYRFTLMREEGVWFSSPELSVIAFNADGDEV